MPVREMPKMVPEEKVVDNVAAAARGVPVEEDVDVSDDEMCQFTSSTSGDKQDIRMLDLFDTLPFDNVDGGVWKQVN